MSLLASSDAPSSLQVVWPQHFHYLARGKQAFAFASDDGLYVLKLFDERNLRDRWYAWVPGLFTKQKKRWAKWRAMYPASYRLAQEHLAEETGVLVVHQGSSTSQYPVVELVDRAARRWRIDLNQTPFVLQRRGSGSLLERLSEVRGDRAALQHVLQQYLAFHAKRIELGIADRDRDIAHNYAWDGEALLCIDPAQFSEAHESPAHAWRAATARLRKWLAREAPDVLPWWDERVSQVISAAMR